MGAGARSRRITPGRGGPAVRRFPRLALQRKRLAAGEMPQVTSGTCSLTGERRAAGDAPHHATVIRAGGPAAASQARMPRRAGWQPAGPGTGRSRPAWPASWRLVTAGAAVLVLAACSGGQAPVKLPAKPSRASAATSAQSPSASPAAATPKAAVESAYTASWAASDKAERSGQDAAARAILAPYVTTSYLGTILTRMAPYWTRHEAAAGYMIDHIKSVYVNSGRAAVVVDCQDASHHYLVDAATGQEVPGSRGPSHAELYTSLGLGSDGKWRVASVTFVAGSCT
jgi:hypothetical protein